MLKKSNLSHITIDCDSTVSTVFGNQQRNGLGYLVKVKLKNLNKLMLAQEWMPTNDQRSICEFEYKATVGPKQEHSKLLAF